MKQIKCKLYLEGIEVPFNSVSISETVGNAAVAKVNLPVNDRFLGILPKTQGHIFYSDTGNDPYYLIFEGALTGISFSRTDAQRGIEATFVSHVAELGSAYIKQIETNVSKLLDDQWIFTGVSQKNFYGKNLGKKTTDTSDTPDEIILRKFKISDATPPTSIISTFMGNLGKDASSDTAYKDLRHAFSSLMQEIMGINAYYGLLDKTLHLHDRIYVSNNELSKKTLDSSVFLALLRDANQTYPTSIPALSVLHKILSFIGYEIVDVAAPTWADGKPRSLIFKPSSDYMLPILPNIIMPYEISSFNYSRDMAAEPTRLIMNSLPLTISINDAHNTFCKFRTLAPYTSFEIGPDKNPIMIPTAEERRRGFNPREGKYRSDVAQIVASISQTFRVGEKPEENKGTYAFIGKETNNTNDLDVVSGKDPALNYLSVFSEKAFYDERYASRSCNITTEYSPHRLIGFPALIVDKILPAVYGTLISIDSMISADGRSSQNLVIASSKLITPPKGDPTDVDVFLNFIPQFPKIYNKDDYSPETVGKTFYNDVVGIETDGSSYSLLDEDVIAKKPNINETTTNLIYTVKKLLSYLENGLDAKKKLSSQLKRTLVTESDFWKFIGRTGEDDDIYSVEGTDPDLTFDKTDVSFKISTPKPFVKERRQRVKLALIKGNIYNV